MGVILLLYGTSGISLFKKNHLPFQHQGEHFPHDDNIAIIMALNCFILVVYLCERGFAFICYNRT